MRPENYFVVAEVFKVLLVVLAIAAVFAFCSPIYFAIKEHRNRKEKIAELYASRERLTDNEFYDRFYKSRNVPKAIVISVRRILAEEFHPLDTTRVLPTDDFTGNLSVIWGEWSGLDGLESVWAVERFEKEFGITITDGEAESMKTLDDIITILSEKVSRKSQVA